MLQNNRKTEFSSMWLIFGEKRFLLIFIPFLRFDKNNCLTNSNFPQYLTLSNIVGKTIFLSISVLVSVIVNFMLKKKIIMNFPNNALKKEIHSLAVFNSLYGEIFFFFIYLSPIIGLIKNSCFNKSKFSSVFTLFKYCQKSKLSEYFSARL